MYTEVTFVASTVSMEFTMGLFSNFKEVCHSFMLLLFFDAFVVHTHCKCLNHASVKQK